MAADGESWRWGLWSPSDKVWQQAVDDLWLASRCAAEQAEPTIPLRIHQIWLGDRPVPEDCRRMMATWQEQHPTWEYTLWTDESAAGILRDQPRLAAAFAAAENPAERSDLLRLELVLRHGGVYVDVDFECLQPLDALHHTYSFYTGMSNVGAFELNNGLFAAATGHPLLRFLCEHVGSAWASWGGDDVDAREAVAYQLEQSGMLAAPLASAAGFAAFLATTGPGFFTRAVMRGLRSAPPEGNAAPVAICPREVFYPLPNRSRDLSLEEKAAHAGPASMAMHHWRRSWADV